MNGIARLLRTAGHDVHDFLSTAKLFDSLGSEGYDLE
jgi:hypothetical protein